MAMRIQRVELLFCMQQFIVKPPVFFCRNYVSFLFVPASFIFLIYNIPACVFLCKKVFIMQKKERNLFALLIFCVYFVALIVKMRYNKGVSVASTHLRLDRSNR